MNPSRLLLTVTTLAFNLVFTFAALAATTSMTSKIPPPIDTRILIKSVDVKADTITIKYMRDAKEPPHTYKIDSVTTLTVNNVKGTIDKIKVGMQVRSYIERDDETLDSVSVDIADPPPVVPKK